ncbi:MAG TPA: RNA methyltransferase [Candidatus Acidoferrum sp.]|nr:RNA methyltransferase [Candidatus Acidoferrum sp.]
MQIIRIPSLDLPELAPYRTLRQAEEHRRASLFVAEGDKVVARLLQSEFGVVSVLLPEKRLAEFEVLIRARREDVPVYVIEIRELEKLVGFAFFQGVLAVGKIPQTPALETILQSAPRPRLFVAIDGLTNSENVGVILRNATAFGAQAMIVDRTSASPFLRRSVRNSLGAIFGLPIVECERVTSALAQLRSAGVRLMAAHPASNNRQIHDADFRGDCCLILGSEGTGISREVLAACDETVTIPMSQEVDSLNVGSAASIFLYEVARQRRS